MWLAAVVRLREKLLPSGGGAPKTEASMMAIEAPSPLLLPPPPLVQFQRRESPSLLLMPPAKVERLEPVPATAATGTANRDSLPGTVPHLFVLASSSSSSSSSDDSSSSSSAAAATTRYSG